MYKHWNDQGNTVECRLTFAEARDLAGTHERGYHRHVHKATKEMLANFTSVTYHGIVLGESPDATPEQALRAELL